MEAVCPLSLTQSSREAPTLLPQSLVELFSASASIGHFPTHPGEHLSWLQEDYGPRPSYSDKFCLPRCYFCRDPGEAGLSQQRGWGVGGGVVVVCVWGSGLRILNASLARCQHLRSSVGLAMGSLAMGPQPISTRTGTLKVLTGSLPPAFRLGGSAQGVPSPEFLHLTKDGTPACSPCSEGLHAACKLLRGKKTFITSPLCGEEGVASV